MNPASPVEGPAIPADALGAPIPLFEVLDNVKDLP